MKIGNIDYIKKCRHLHDSCDRIDGKTDLLLFYSVGIMLPVFEASVEGTDSKQTCVVHLLSSRLS